MRFVAAMVLAGCVCTAREARPVLWRDPANISQADLGGTVVAGVPVPKPPFLFIKEDAGGTQPKVLVRDAAGIMWDVKFGYEVKPECFTWRIPRAVGYFVEPNLYVAAGHFEQFVPLRRTTS